MKNYFIFFVFSFLLTTAYSGRAQGFEQKQRQYARVQTAFAEKEEIVKKQFNLAHVTFPPKQIYIQVYKYERKVELWAMPSEADTFKLITQYDFCSSSGSLGPKRQQGDYQIPEGFYYIERFNPVSNFYLSLGLNYPNSSDKILGKKGNLGDDIFIHGNCVTIGCIPITDDKIKELYLVAVKAKSGGQNHIPVHIFPYNFADNEKEKYFKHLKKYADLKEFWQELKQGFLFFERNHRLPQILVNKQTGHYYLKQ